MVTFSMDSEKDKQLEDFKPEYSCRFHPTDWWHEVGCPHKEWTVEELQKALDSAKQSNAYLGYLRITEVEKIRSVEFKKHDKETLEYLNRESKHGDFKYDGMAGHGSFVPMSVIELYLTYGKNWQEKVMEEISDE